MNIQAHHPPQLPQASKVAAAERPIIAAESPGTTGPATDPVTLSSGFQVGQDNIYSLSVLALGGEGQLRDWQGQGLEVSGDTIEKAYEVWNQGFKDAMRSPGKSSLALNRYDIVIGSQQVPDWFMQERHLYMEALTDAEIKASFGSGSLYHVTDVARGPNARELSIYNEIARTR